MLAGKILVLGWLAFSAGWRADLARAAELSSPADAAPGAGPVLNQTNARGPVSAVIHFRNGDRLSGLPENIAPDRGVLWQRNDLRQGIAFDLAQVKAVDFFTLATGAAASSNACKIRLRSEEILEGELIGLDARAVTLGTWYAGQLAIPRNQLDTIAPTGFGFATLFAGPEGVEGWTHGKVTNPQAESGQWTYRQGAFYARQSASIARDLKLPDLCSLRFDLAWKGTLHLAVALYTDYLHPVSLATKEKEPDFGGFYSLQLNMFYANLLPVRQFDPLRYLGTVPVPAFSSQTRAQVEVRINKPKRLIALLVDGLLIKQWVDNEDFAGRGTGVRFVHQGAGQVRLSNLRVLQWDGQFEEPLSSTNSTKLGPSRADQLHLRNGDKVEGRLDSIRDGVATLEMDATRLPVPWSRLRRIDLLDEKPSGAASTNATVRLRLASGGLMDLRLVEWTPQALRGEHAVLGPVALHPGAIEKMEFRSRGTP
jgi:hypothetical protein